MRNNIKFLIIFTSISFLSGCATRTKYKPHNDHTGGYSHSELKDNLYVSRFAANAKTHQNDAHLFSNFHAIELCLQKGFKFTRVLDVKDLSEKKSIYNSTTTFYGSNGVVFGSTIGSETKLNLPIYDTIFTCENEFKVVGAIVKNIPAKEASTITKDYLGALQIVEVPSDSHNDKILQDGDVVIKVDGKRIQGKFSFNKELNKKGSKTKITIIRDGKRIVKEVALRDGSQLLKDANMHVIENACSVPEIKKNVICMDLEAVRNNL